MTDAKKTFPMLPVAHWWALRKKFKQSIPGVVTDNYLATVLDMKVDSARGNVLPYLKQLGIVDDEGRTGERAREWRDDEGYGKVCAAMLREVYPDELLQAVPDPDQNRAKAERWFANHTGTGTVATRRMASLYAVLVEGDATKEPDEAKKKERPTKGNGARAVPVRSARAVTMQEKIANAKPAVVDLDPNPSAGTKGRQLPDININLQVHISADATSDQIDQIFASMAKHIYPRD